MSLFAPKFEDDIFINYSHADNDEPLDEKKRGWVDAFHDFLEKRLKSITGVDPKIWRDREKMRGNGRVPSKLEDALEKVALLMPILSPSYLTSDWCIPELSEFYRRACQACNIDVDNESRIFKVIKLPVPEDKHPTMLRDLRGYEFYEDQNGVPCELSHICGSDGYPIFVDRLNLLAWDISTFVNKLCRDTDPPFRTVYLAETTADLKKERDEIRRELEMKKYCVLPDKSLPKDGPEFKAAVRAYLGRSGLSIHLIGGEIGCIPAKETHDDVYLQHQLALERHSSPDFFRVVWTPRGLETQEPFQQRFIHDLWTRPEFQMNAELMLGSTWLSDLKDYVLSKLKSMEPKQPERPRLLPAPPVNADNDVQALWSEPLVEEEPAKETTSVYLIFDKKDLETVRPLRRYLGKLYNVTWPILEAGPKKGKQNREEHERNMAECDVAIVFYGKAKEIWVREKLNELKKSMAHGQNKPRPISALYITGPINDDKEFYETGCHYQVVKNLGEFSEEPLKPLIDEIQKRLSQKRSKGAAR
jgi:hypothetical protein